MQINESHRNPDLPDVAATIGLDEDDFIFLLEAQQLVYAATEYLTDLAEFRDGLRCPTCQGAIDGQGVPGRTTLEEAVFDHLGDWYLRHPNLSIGELVSEAFEPTVIAARPDLAIIRQALDTLELVSVEDDVDLALSAIHDYGGIGYLRGDHDCECLLAESDEPQ